MDLVALIGHLVIETTILDNSLLILLAARSAPRPSQTLPNRLINHILDEPADAIPVPDGQLVIPLLKPLPMNLRLHLFLLLFFHIGFAPVELVHVEHFSVVLW